MTKARRTMADNFVENLIAHCRRSGLSYAELSRISGVHFVTISRIVTGKSTPSVCTCEKLARAAKMRTSKIFLAAS